MSAPVSVFARGHAVLPIVVIMLQLPAQKPALLRRGFGRIQGNRWLAPRYLDDLTPNTAMASTRRCRCHVVVGGSIEAPSPYPAVLLPFDPNGDTMLKLSRSAIAGARCWPSLFRECCALLSQLTRVVLETGEPLPSLPSVRSAHLRRSGNWRQQRSVTHRGDRAFMLIGVSGNAVLHCVFMLFQRSE